MRSLTISRPSPALVLAIVALFVALGGTTYAAAKMSGKAIKRGSIPANRIVPNTLGGKQIKEAKLGIVPAAQSAQTAQSAQSATTADSAQTAKTAEKAASADSAVTAQTAQTSSQLAGRGPGAFMASGTRVVVDQSPIVPTGGTADVTASCAPDERAISGGGAWIVPNNGNPSTYDLPITATMPVPHTAVAEPLTGWRVVGRNDGGFDRTLHAYAVCVPKAA